MSALKRIHDEYNQACLRPIKVNDCIKFHLFIFKWYWAINIFKLQQPSEYNVYYKT